MRQVYCDNLLIIALDLTRSTLNAFWYILWDPTEPVATRPLAIQTAGGWFTYGLDLTKNVTELYKSDGTIANAYAYEPFGGVTQAGIITNPLQWSSEVYDAELGMVYYNFRFYNPRDGRWTSRDLVEEENGNLYELLTNRPLQDTDILGLVSKNQRNQKSLIRREANLNNRYAKKQHQIVSSNAALAKPNVAGSALDLAEQYQTFSDMRSNAEALAMLYALISSYSFLCSQAQRRTNQCSESKGCCVILLEVTMRKQVMTDEFYFTGISRYIGTEYYNTPCSTLTFMDKISSPYKYIFRAKIPF